MLPETHAPGLASPSSVAAELRSLARGLGASRIGICAADPLPHGQELLRWLGNGFQAGMGYMARGPERRSDPRLALPGARSVVVVAVDHEHRATNTESGRVARYAANRDYHDVLRDILASLGRFLEERHGARVKAYVDTGPLLERELGMRAGLGFIGKNTMLIDRRSGSYFVLGELLTDFRLAEDAPATPHCGSCTRCIDLCPTGALVAPYELDSARCISYLTIEHRGAVAPRMRAATGDWLFGCDVCQEVCPWNGKRRVAAIGALAGAPEIAPDDLLALDERAFRERFRGSPLMRPKRPGLVRNMLLVLVNRAPPGSGGRLRRALRDADPAVRRLAAWALARLAERNRRNIPCRRVSRRTKWISLGG